ncbi:hypothetical protein A2U94_19660 [Bacillus sp. VT 712]|uniref:hypothetical protein n=1 Tax=Bacillaceae TaxID=186817 RepID=UPI0007A4197D|nr:MULTISPECIES: hypothetical protein [Bacillaceae]KZB89791.1 hypothetical protein A2U94_19660 [Bacillus sp. VT 712]
MDIKELVIQDFLENQGHIFHLMYRGYYNQHHMALLKGQEVALSNLILQIHERDLNAETDNATFLYNFTKKYIEDGYQTGNEHLDSALEKEFISGASPLNI